jgi:hypothetical protein
MLLGARHFGMAAGPDLLTVAQLCNLGLRSGHDEFNGSDIGHVWGTFLIVSLWLLFRTTIAFVESGDEQ